jgi:CheY-like chemotaxis protein/anti-sigma regulatory factor (Ser/Thr protein kinase)
MLRILVVDDAAVDRHLVSRLLEKEPDWEIAQAVDGVEALEQLALDAFDVVLTDLQMPRLDGLKLVSEVKKKYPLIPVVLMTSEGSEEVAVRALQAGAASYVPKRKLVGELREVIRRVLIAARSDWSNAEILRRVIESSSHIRIETSLRMVASLLQYARGIIQSTPGIPVEDHVRIGVAVEEAVMNAYYHGNLEVSSEFRDGESGKFHSLAKERCSQEPYCSRHIDLLTRLTPEKLTFVVRDEGPGFNVSALIDPTAPENLDRAHGRGVMLMHMFLDEVQFNDPGNEVTLTSYLKTDAPPVERALNATH